MPSDYVALEPEGLAFLGPMRLQKLETILDRLPPTRYCIDSRLKQLFSKKNAYLIVQELWPKEKASGLAYILGLWLMETVFTPLPCPAPI